MNKERLRILNEIMFVISDKSLPVNVETNDYSDYFKISLTFDEK